MDDVERTWHRYKTTGEQRDRDHLIATYLPLVRYVAAQVANGLPSNITRDDLVSPGSFGLIDSIEKYDLDRGIKFETYAITRIRGAILDELRSTDWVPRSVRAKARAIEHAHTDLETHLHRNPTDGELADELGATITQLRSTRTQIALAGVVALEEPVLSDEPLTVGDTIAHIDHPPTDDMAEFRTIIAEAISDVPLREQVVPALYYSEGLTLAEIGQVLGVTESRVCQIHTRVVQRLRSALVAQESP